MLAKAGAGLLAAVAVGFFAVGWSVFDRGVAYEDVVAAALLWATAGLLLGIAYLGVVIDARRAEPGLPDTPQRP